MAGVYTGETRIRLPDGYDPPAEYLQFGQKAVSVLLEYAKHNGLKSVHKRYDLPDGTVVTVSFDGTLPVVEITPGLPVVSSLSKSSGLWIPRGFVVYPASTNARRGVGLPVIQQGTNPYDPVNLDPGVSFDRWTPGGPHGQVLFTHDLQAGYPSPLLQLAPIFYSPLGPTVTYANDYDARPAPSPWIAIRPSYSDFIQHYDNDPTALRQELFAAVNTYRTNSGVAAAYLMPVAFYRPAEVLSYLMSSNGLVQAAYLPGYQTLAQRETKDGFWSQTQTAYKEIVAVGGSPTSVVDNWEGTHDDVLLYQPDHTPVFADVGFSGGNSTLVTAPREQWIMAGRRSFQSADPLLPPISWDGPPALNLGWLTFPIIHAYENLFTPAAVVDDTGAFYQKYYTSDYGFQPGIGPNVYCRGRTLGAMPNNGMVLGAGIIPLATVDRVVVIAYHTSENIGLAPTTQGLMAVCHVWYADFASGVDLRLHAEQPVTVWSDGGKHTLPGMKYDSFWEFRPDGMKAVCLRDQADISVIASALQTPNHSGFFLGQLVANAWSGSMAGVVCEMAVVLSTIPGFIYTTTPVGSLAYAALGDPLIGNFRPTLWPPNQSGIPTDAWSYEQQLVPHAAGYVNNAIQLAYTGASVLLQNRTDPRTADAFVPAESINMVAFGPPSIQYASQATSYTIVGKGAVGYGTDGYAAPAGPAPVFANIASQTFALDVYTVPESITSFTIDPDDPDYYNVAGAPVLNATTEFMNTSSAQRRVRMYQNGSLLNESTYSHTYGVPWAVYQFRFVRDVGGSSYFSPQADGNSDPQHSDPSPVDPSYVLNFDLPKNIYTTATTHIFVSVVDQTLQPFYVQRFGETMTGYQVGLCSPVSTIDFKGMKNPVLQDRAAAFAGSLFDVITETQRTVTGGWYKVSFNAPAVGAGWFAQAVVV